MRKSDHMGEKILKRNSESVQTLVNADINRIHGGKITKFVATSNQINSMEITALEKGQICLYISQHSRKGQTPLPQAKHAY